MVVGYLRKHTGRYLEGVEVKVDLNCDVLDFGLTWHVALLVFVFGKGSSGDPREFKAVKVGFL